jgi:hypothetical protein
MEYCADASYIEHARLHLDNSEVNAAKFLLTRLIKDNKTEGSFLDGTCDSQFLESSTEHEYLERSSSQASALVMVAELSDQKADEHFARAS